MKERGRDCEGERERGRVGERGGRKESGEIERGIDCEGERERGREGKGRENGEIERGRECEGERERASERNYHTQHTSN